MFVTCLVVFHFKFLLFIRVKKINILQDSFIMNKNMRAIRINGSFIIPVKNIPLA